MNKLTIDFPNGSRFLIDSEVIAHSRASYYANKEFDKNQDSCEKASVYKEEFEYAMSDLCELRDWAFNNMSWEDVFSETARVEDLYDYGMHWCEAEINKL